MLALSDFQSALSNVQITYNNKQIEMQAKQISYLSSFLSFSFFEAVQKFQEMVEEMIKDQSLIKTKPQVEQKTVILVRRINHLYLGNNISRGIKIVVHRIVTYINYCFLLAAQNETSDPVDPSCLYCIILTSSEYFTNEWQNQIGLNMSLIIKEPYLDANYPKSHKLLTTIYAKASDIVLPPIKDYKSKAQDIKAKGNQYFKFQDYYNALLFYEHALACFQFGGSKKDRAILYANASASLHEMKLYDISIRYAKISIKLDKSYAKGYFRLVKSLLQIENFTEIPSLLVNYSETTDAVNLNKLNQKYTFFIATSLGIIKWSEILFPRSNQLIFANYASHKIEQKQFDNTQCYYAKQQLLINQFLIMNKPLYFLKNANEKINQDEIYTHIEKYMQLENAFKQQIQNLIKKKNDQRGEEAQRKKILSVIKKNVIKLQDFHAFTDNQAKGDGIWTQFMNFSHSCQPNCSYIHFKKGLMVTSSKKINQGERLTLDFAQYQQPLNRKMFLKNKFNIDCSCQVCQWREWPEQKATYIQKITLCDYLQNQIMLKQLLLNMLKDRKSFTKPYQSETSYKDAVERYIKVTKTQTHWVDLVRMIELNNNEDISKPMKNMIQKALQQKTAQIFNLVGYLGVFADL